MSRHKTPPETHRRTRMTFLVTDAEREEIHRNSKQMLMEPSSYIRMALKCVKPDPTKPRLLHPEEAPLGLTFIDADPTFAPVFDD